MPADSLTWQLTQLAQEVRDNQIATDSKLSQVAGMVGTLTEGMRDLQADRKEMWGRLGEVKEMQAARSGINPTLLIAATTSLMLFIGMAAGLAKAWNTMENNGAVWKNRFEALEAQVERSEARYEREIEIHERIVELEAKLSVATGVPRLPR